MKSIVYPCVAGLALAAPSQEDLDKFQQFCSKWGHNYVGTEYQKRSGYFEQNLQEIEKLQQLETGTAVYSHLGPFADFSADQMNQRLGFFDAGGSDETPVASFLNVTLEHSDFDWVEKGAVNSVQNQGTCGSCWAFSTVCNLEGTGKVSGYPLVKLSEQELVDCDKTSLGCLGGLPSRALKWSSRRGGIASEREYPYKGWIGEIVDWGTCQRAGRLTHNTGYTKISKNEDEIKVALVTYGPLSIAVDARPFQHYHKGIMRNPSCSKVKLDHAINIVGYGSEGVQYWKIRNSWGKMWGEAGYIRIQYGDCVCGLCTTVISATGVTVSSSLSKSAVSVMV